MNGNWSEQDMTSQLGASTTQAALALTAFWAMVTIGRVLFAVIERWLPAPDRASTCCPSSSSPRSLLTAVLPDDSPWLGVAVFGLAGLGCSALLPLTISLGQSALTSMSAAVAGGVIAFYQVGYGIAAFGVGPLVDHGASLSDLYGWTAAAAAVLALLSFAIAGGQPSSEPASRPVPDSAPSASRHARHERAGPQATVGSPARHHPRRHARTDRPGRGDSADLHGRRDGRDRWLRGR